MMWSDRHQPGLESLSGHVAELNALDTAIIDAIRVRTELARALGTARLRAGHPRTAHKDELVLVTRFRELGAEGAQLATALLRMSRHLTPTTEHGSADQIA